jgi:hypothetical protein
MLAAGIALVAARFVLGRGWTFVVGGIAFLLATGNVIGGHAGSGSVARSAAVYVGCAVAVELAALLVGTHKPLRFAIASGLGLATIGLAGEWAWNQGALQRWTPALLPDALILSLVAALGAAVVGVAFGGAIARQRLVRGSVLACAALAIVFSLVWPLPRHSLDAQAQVHLTPSRGGVIVTAHLTPADAGHGARWFQAMAWQGGGMIATDMVEREPGVYVSKRAVPVGGRWKTVLRIQKGAALASVPIWFPKDAAIGKPEIPAVDRTMAFAQEQKYLLREQHSGAGWFAPIVYAILLFIALLWITAFVVAARRVSTPLETEPTRELVAA